tara:strand:- start:620 stop:2752 length:2133 start_codon:yes stop_codon:yes gene_type:complete
MFTKTSLTLITIFAVNFGFVCKVYSNQDQVNTYYASDLGVYSLEELNYETCKIYDHRRANKEGNLYIKNLNMTPENMRPMLVNYMCDFSLGSRLSGSPRQLTNPKHYDYKFIDGKHKYIVKSGFRELDFEAETAIFLKEFKSKLLNCKSDLPRNNCFGAGVVWNGFYVGEWRNNKPHGHGIQLLTRGVPYSFDKKVWNSIYRGAFKDGMFHGEGKFFNLKQSFEGNWFRGEMHGKIEWQWPVIFDFGFAFIRHKSGIGVTEVSSFGPAESAGLRVGDIISTITYDDRIIKMDETGIKSIKRFLNEVDANDEISIQILDRTYGLVLAFYDNAQAVCTPNSEKYSKNLCDKEYQLFYKACRAALNKTKIDCRENLEQWIPKIANNEQSNEYLSISFSKSQTRQKDQTAMFCIASRDEKCYEKSKLKNIFSDNGKISRGSYLMGMKHAYTQDDMHIYKQDDSSHGLQLFCHGNPPPLTVLTKDKKLLEKIKFVTPSAFIFDTGYNTPCLHSREFAIYGVTSFAFPHLLKDNQESLELLSDLSGLYMVDIIDYLDDFIMQLDAGISPKNIKSIAHQWCNYDLLYIYCGYGRSDDPYVIHQKTKIIDNPETKAHERKKESQYKRAEENFFILSSCRSKYQDGPDDSTQRSLFKTCVAKLVKQRIGFWTCVYRGEAMSHCSAITNSSVPREVDAYKMNNPNALLDVNLNEWIYGDL